MPITIEDVSNMALARLGEASIASINDATPAARACRRLFGTVRDLLLGAVSWGFASARVQLVPTGIVPAGSKWQCQFLKPTDCIKPRVLEVPVTGAFNMANDDRIMFDEAVELIGGVQTPVINTNQSAVALLYTRQLTDPNTWDSDFVSVMSIQLAAEIAIPITMDGRLAQALRQASADAIAAIRGPGQNEGVSQVQRGSRAMAAREQ